MVRDYHYFCRLELKCRKCVYIHVLRLICTWSTKSVYVKIRPKLLSPVCIYSLFHVLFSLFGRLFFSILLLHTETPSATVKSKKTTKKRPNKENRTWHSEYMHTGDRTSVYVKLCIGMHQGIQNTFVRTCDKIRLEIQSRKYLRKSNYNDIT